VSAHSTAQNWIKRSLIATRALDVIHRLQRTRVAVLMYHSVMEEPERHATTLGNIIISAKNFRRQMEVLARDYNPLSLNDALQFIQGHKQLPAKPVVVTFDDGYRDNAEVAAPILNQLDIPGVFYVTVSSIDRAMPPWVAKLRYAFSTTGKGAWGGFNGDVYPLATSGGRERAFTIALEHCACLTGRIQEGFVAEVERELETGAMPEESQLMMTWQQTRKLIDEGHIVGSHTMSHPNLAHVQDDLELRSELEESKRRLEQKLDSPVIHFSYPCPVLQPHWSARTVELCRQLGYSTAVTTDPGAVSEGDDPLTMHRVRPTRDIDGLRWNLECAFLGRPLSK